MRRRYPAGAALIVVALVAVACRDAGESARPVVPARTEALADAAPDTGLAPESANAAPASPDPIEISEATSLPGPLPGPFPLPSGFDAEWEPWFAHVDWVVGMEAGQSAARASGKPMLLFYTATW